MKREKFSSEKKRNLFSVHVTWEFLRKKGCFIVDKKRKERKNLSNLPL